MENLRKRFNCSYRVSNSFVVTHIREQDYFPEFPESPTFKLNGEEVHKLKLFESLVDVSPPHDKVLPQEVAILIDRRIPNTF